MLRPLVKGLHGGGGHSQRQRRIKSTKLQLDQLETFCSSELRVRKQVIELFAGANRAVVLRWISWTEGSCQLGVIPVWKLVVRSAKPLAIGPVRPLSSALTHSCHGSVAQPCTRRC